MDRSALGLCRVRCNAGGFLSRSLDPSGRTPALSLRRTTGRASARLLRSLHDSWMRRADSSRSHALAAASARPRTPIGLRALGPGGEARGEDAILLLRYATVLLVDQRAYVGRVICLFEPSKEGAVLGRLAGDRSCRGLCERPHLPYLRRRTSFCRDRQRTETALI